MSEEIKEKKGLERKDPKGILDKFISKFASRKLSVMIVATAALFTEKTLTSEDWSMIALVYIGSQALVDMAATWRKAG